MAAESPIEHGGRRQALVEKILAGIFAREFQPLERLRVTHLADMYGVSATPVREALVELAALGVVDLQPNRGAGVRPFGPQQVREICQVRRVLECEATRCASGRIAPFELQVLQRELEALVAAKRGPQWSTATRELDTKLHDLIRSRAGSARLADEIARYAVLSRALRDARHKKRQTWDDYEAMDENAEHLRIVQALARGNADEAAAAMAAHINQAARAIEQDLFEPEQIAAAAHTPFLPDIISR